MTYAHTQQHDTHKSIPYADKLACASFDFRIAVVSENYQRLWDQRFECWFETKPNLKLLRMLHDAVISCLTIF